MSRRPDVIYASDHARSRSRTRNRSYEGYTSSISVALPKLFSSCPFFFYESLEELKNIDSLAYRSVHATAPFPVLSGFRLTYLIFSYVLIGVLFGGTTLTAVAFRDWEIDFAVLSRFLLSEEGESPADT